MTHKENIKRKKDRIKMLSGNMPEHFKSKDTEIIKYNIEEIVELEKNLSVYLIAVKEELEFLKHWYSISTWKTEFKDDVIEERIKECEEVLEVEGT